MKVCATSSGAFSIKRSILLDEDCHHTIFDLYALLFDLHFLFCDRDIFSVFGF